MLDDCGILSVAIANRDLLDWDGWISSNTIFHSFKNQFLAWDDFSANILLSAAHIPKQLFG